jgi:cytochrome bd ubiquinol oxidase subunit I
VLVAAGRLSYVAAVAGWITTEVGRQPWIVYGVMRTAQAVTRANAVPVGYATLVVVYLSLGAAVTWVLRRMSRVPLPETKRAA